MFHKAIKLEYGEGTTLRLTFQDGWIKAFDMALLFSKYPQLEALNERSLFLSGKLVSPYGVIWNDDLDIETETVYEEGITIGKEDVPLSQRIGALITDARGKVGLTQTELAAAVGIDQSDLSKIERGQANPSLLTLQRIADGLGTRMDVTFSSAE